MTRAAEHLEKVEVTSQAALREWLATHHTQTESVWLVRWKKHVTDKHLSMEDIIDELLCWGWIDSLPRRLDEDRTMILVSKRRAGSNWSGVNKRNIARLAPLGRIQPPGQAAIDRAKADGTWSFLDDVDRLERPSDLVAALAAAGATQGFDAYPPSLQRAVLEWIKLAKRPETRAKRISKTADCAARGEKPL